jgi:hypothetical protein
MITLRGYLRILLAGLFGVFFCIVTGGSANGDVLSVSIKSISLKEKERIIGFDLRIKAGMIVALPAVPAGWYISVNNGSSWNTEVKGSIAVGSAAIDPAFFNNFIVIEKNESPGLKLDIKAEVIVSEDFENERRINVDM